MRRFDLLDEFSSICAPRISPARDRDPDHGDVGSGGAWRDWRFGVTGIVAILVVAILAL